VGVAHLGYLDEMKKYIDSGAFKLNDSELVHGLVYACDIDILSARAIFSEWRDIPIRKAREATERVKRENAVKEAEANIAVVEGKEAGIKEIMYCVSYEPPMEIQGRLESVIGSSVKVYRDTNGKDYAIDCLKSWTELSKQQQVQIEEAEKIKNVTGHVKPPKLIEKQEGN